MRVCSFCPYKGSNLAHLTHSSLRTRQDAACDPVGFSPPFAVTTKKDTPEWGRKQIAAWGRRQRFGGYSSATHSVAENFLRSSPSRPPSPQLQKKTPPNGGVFFCGAAWGTRTLDLLVRSQALYPTELKPHVRLSTYPYILAQVVRLVNRFLKKIYFFR